MISLKHSEAKDILAALDMKKMCGKILRISFIKIEKGKVATESRAEPYPAIPMKIAIPSPVQPWCLRLNF